MQSFNQVPTCMFSPGTSRVGSRPRFMPVTGLLQGDPEIAAVRGRHSPHGTR